MLKPKVQRSVARIVSARAGHNADRLPATVSGAPANKSNVVPERSGESAQKSAENPSVTTGNRLLKENLDHVLGTLNERERRIVEMRFGLVDGYGRTLEELGKHYKLTRERIRQIEAKALRKMRHPTRAFHLKGFLEVAEVAAAA